MKIAVQKVELEAPSYQTKKYRAAQTACFILCICLSQVYHRDQERTSGAFLWGEESERHSHLYCGSSHHPILAKHLWILHSRSGTGLSAAGGRHMGHGIQILDSLNLQSVLQTEGVYFFEENSIMCERGGFSSRKEPYLLISSKIWGNSWAPI